MDIEPEYQDINDLDLGPAEERRSEFYIKTPPVAKAFMALAGATIVMTAFSSFFIGGYRAELIAQQKLNKEAIAQKQEAINAANKASQSVPRSFPATGSVQWHKVYSGASEILNLSIDDKTGNGRNKIISIEDVQTQTAVANLYLQANSQAKISLPASEYKLTLNEGDIWFGPLESFGAQNKTLPIGVYNLTRDYDLVLKFSSE